MEHCKGAICTAQATIKIIIVIRLRMVRMIRMHRLAMAIMMSVEIENDVKSIGIITMIMIMMLRMQKPGRAEHIWSILMNR